VKARQVKGLDPTGTLGDNAEKIVRVRLDELCSFMPKASDPDEVVALHDMRIAAKRLRYVLEIVEPCFAAEAPAARRAARQLQALLGDLHDCDVMLARAEGIESLTTLLRTRREGLFRRFEDLCQATARKGTWAALERSL